MADDAKPRRRSVAVPLSLLVVVAVALGGFWLWRGAPAVHPIAEGGDLWGRWLHPVKGPLVMHGNVEVRQVDLGFKVAGRIEQLAVDEGDKIVKGQTIASLEKVYFASSLAETHAQRDQARANLDKMEAGNRPEDIAESEATLAEQEATLQDAKQAFDRAQSLLNSASGTMKTFDDALATQREAAARVNVARHARDLMKAGFRKEDIDATRAQLAQQDAALDTAAPTR